MNLSDFDLSWYQQWALTHEPLEEWSRPGLTNGLGSVQVCADPSSLRHMMFPPVSSAEESTAYLSINDQLLVATRNPCTLRWTPWAVERQSQHEGWEIQSRCSMAPGKAGILQRIEISNRGGEARELRASMRLSGRCVNRGTEAWYWGVPRVGLTVSDIHGHSGLNPQVDLLEQQGLCFQERAIPDAKAGSKASFAGQAYSVQLLSPTPDTWNARREAEYVRELAPGEGFVFYLALSLEDRDTAVETARSLLADPEALFAAAEAEWRELWRSAFAEGGPLDGRLSDMDLPESLAPVAVSAILCALYSRRSFPVAGGIPAYNISSPRRVEACFYPNDWALAGALLAEIEPSATWRQLNMALAGDIRKNNQVNLLTGQGGDADGSPWPYTVDVFNCFYVAWELWQQGGADPEQLLTQQITHPQRELSLLETFEDLAFDWRRRKVDAYGLADYGPKEELLECVSTYEHLIAGLNAGAAWMLFRMADLYAALGREADAAAVTAEGEALVEAILSQLYVEGGGYFRCIDLEGEAREVRTCWDFGMVGFCIGERLPQQVQQEMTAFFRKELQTPGWLRALSPLDADAATSGIRADHQYNGAYGAWPAQCALALLRFGERELVLSWFEGIARSARQGPFAQAHYDEGVWPETCEGATKVTEEAPQCTHWCNLSGGLFWVAMKELFAPAN